jgi:hypothetical protein
MDCKESWRHEVGEAEQDQTAKFDGLNGHHTRKTAKTPRNRLHGVNLHLIQSSGSVTGPASGPLKKQPDSPFPRPGNTKILPGASFNRGIGPLLLQRTDAAKLSIINLNDSAPRNMTDMSVSCSAQLGLSSIC